MILPGRRVRRLRDGTFELRLSRQERTILTGLPEQVIALLESGQAESGQSQPGQSQPDQSQPGPGELGPSRPGEVESTEPEVRRLFPPAYAEDAHQEAEYRRLMGADLLASHRQALTVMQETVQADRLDREQLAAWMGALNDLRLVLGTRLDVSEDMSGVSVDDPRAAEFTVYGYLGWLQEQVVEALAAEL